MLKASPLLIKVQKKYSNNNLTMSQPPWLQELPYFTNECLIGQFKRYDAHEITA